MFDSKQLKRWLTENDYVLEVTGNGHLRVRTASGEFKGVIAVTPSKGCRSVENDIANLRRRGVPIPRK